MPVAGTAGPVAVPAPEVRFANPAYYAMPGQTVTFDVSASLPCGVNMAQYEWDFDGNGVVDQIASTASTGVHIGRGPRDGFPVAPVNVSVVVTAHSDGISTVHITWEPGGPEPYRWGVTVNGIPAGVVEGAARSATLTDVRRARDVTIGVVGFTQNQAMGDSANVTLPALSS